MSAKKKARSKRATAKDELEGLKKECFRQTAELESYVSELGKNRVALGESEEKFRSICTSVIDAVLVMDSGGLISYWNKAAEDIFGYSQQEAVGADLHTLIVPDQYRDAFSKGFKRFRKTGKGDAIGKVLELTALRRDGTEFPIGLSLSAFMLKGDWNAVGVIRDITEQKQTEAALQRFNRTLKTLSHCNHALVYARKEELLLQEICQICVEDSGYRLAWVGYAEQDAAKTVRPAAYAGFEEGYLESLNITWADDEHGRGPTGRAIRSGKPYIAQDIPTDPNFAPWREQALKRGYVSSISLPLIADDLILGVLNIYAVEADAFDEQEVELLTELADDLAFGITTLRMRTENERLQVDYQRGMEKLKQVLVDTVQAMAMALEKRDPYTAGHQRRVAQLAKAIAKEMALPADRIDGIYFGGIIHDIGKIYVPAEILSRPGRLSQAEFEVIKSHAQVGYDIVCGVQFPWPVADMVLQHHERLDGSGYPNGLKNGDICLEARILAVADVVEAMASHRPYRPGLGIDVALQEIRKNRGILYDPAAVDICLRLFNDNGFEFEAAVCCFEPTPGNSIKTKNGHSTAHQAHKP